MRGWWAGKIGRTWGYFWARVRPDELAELETWLTPAQLSLFGAMHRADRRHCLDVLVWLRANGAANADLLLAGLLHDCGKGRRIRFVHRVAWSLGQRYGEWIWRWSGRLPTFRAGLERLRRHAELSAELAKQAGCSRRTVELIRMQENPTDEAGRLLLAADEAC